MKLYAVGGAVRDHLRGMRGKDLDFAVETTSFDHMMELLKARGLEVYVSLPEFVTVRGRMPLDSLGDFGGLLPLDLYRDTPRKRQYFVDADFTLCREEAQYSDLRHPDTVTPADLLTDLNRRDFTMNAVAVSETGEYIDPWFGRDDIMARRIFTVGDAHDRFTEDPLRILRAIRFSVTLDFSVALVVQNEMNEHAMLLTMLPVERVVTELRRAAVVDWAKTMRKLFVEYPRIGNILAAAFPEMWMKPTVEDR